MLIKRHLSSSWGAFYWRKIVKAITI